MKTIRFSTSLFAFLLVLSLVSLTSCANEELAPDQLAANSIQADLQQGGQPTEPDCFCISPCNTFDVSHEVDAFASGPTNFDFQVTVYPESECDQSALVGKDCDLYPEVRLKYLYPADGSLTNFSNFQVLNLAGQPMSYEVDPENSGFIANSGFTVLFKWNPANSGNEAPTNAEFSSGGLCIIGIVNDPNGDDHTPEPDPYDSGSNG